MKKAFCLLLTLALVLGLAACGAPEAGLQSTAPAVVELEGNATTGYAWAASEETAALFGELAPEYLEGEAPEGEERPVGQGGVSRFTFAPEQLPEAGSYEAEFLYYRSWEGAESAAKRAVVPVTVSEDGSLTLGEAVVTDYTAKEP